MTKIELIRKVKKAVDKATLKDITLIVDATLENIKDAVAAGEKVALFGFGSFEASERAAKKGRNPVTGESLHIEAFKAPKFTAGKTFKDAVKNS